MSREVDAAMKRMNRSAYAGDLNVTLRRLIPARPAGQPRNFDVVGVYAVPANKPMNNSTLWFVVCSVPPKQSEHRTYEVYEGNGRNFWAYMNSPKDSTASLDSLEAAVFAGALHFERPI